MPLEIVVAIIAAASPIVVALIGAYVALKTQPVPVGAGAVAGPGSRTARRKTWGVVALAVMMAALIVGLASVSISRMDRQLRSYKKLISVGFAKNKTYVIPSLLMLVQIEKTSDGTKLESTRHIFYQLHALSDIHRDKPGFDEDYDSSYPLDYIHGPDKEDVFLDSIGTKKWNLFFDSPAGERRLILTGAHVTTSNPIDRNHDILMFKGLGTKEDAFCYSNADGDVIEEAVIVIESRSLDLFLPSGENALLVHGNDQTPVDSTIYSNPSNGSVQYTVAARFRNLQDGDNIGLKIGWH